MEDATGTEPGSSDKPLGVSGPDEEALMFKSGESAPAVGARAEHLSVQARLWHLPEN